MVGIHTYILFAIAFLANCLMDDIAHHKQSSKFLHWFKRFPKFYKWLTLPWDERPDYRWYDLRQMVMDGWHFSKSIMFGVINAELYILDTCLGAIFTASWVIWFTIPHRILEINVE